MKGNVCSKVLLLPIAEVKMSTSRTCAQRGKLFSINNDLLPRSALRSSSKLSFGSIITLMPAVFNSSLALPRPLYQQACDEVFSLPFKPPFRPHMPSLSRDKPPGHVRDEQHFSLTCGDAITHSRSLSAAAQTPPSRTGERTFISTPRTLPLLLLSKRLSVEGRIDHLPILNGHSLQLYDSC